MRLEIGIKVWGHPVLIPPTSLPKHTICHDAGRIVSLTAYAMAQSEAALQEDFSKSATSQLMEGLHSRRVSRYIAFDRCEFSIGDDEVEYMYISAHFAVHVRTPKITSKFDIAGRGRVYTYEAPEAVGLPAIKVEFVTKEPRRPAVQA